ncbi:MAG TPA: S41 family peptidase [Bryobacteraceae bacterium]
MSSRLKILVVTSSTCLVVLFLCGAMMSKGAPAPGAEDSTPGVYRHIAVFTEVLTRIKSEYVEEPDMKNVTLGAMNGLLESIDPYASYLNAEQYKEYLKNYDSYRGDLGLVLAKKFGYIAVVSAVPGSPAAKAGLTTGDMIETIKGIATRDMPLAYANLLLRGQPGSTVEISVLQRRPDPHKLTLERTVIQYPAVEEKMMDGSVGYIRPDTLASGKVQEVSNDIADLQKKGAKKLILDLRDCAVGAPEDGVELANLFMKSGEITHVQGQKYPRQEIQAKPNVAVTQVPMVVITNRGTASAAEVAAAALQDSNRAEVVGEHTFGDASIRRAVTMDDGSAIILSVAKYYSPAGKSIQDEGVTPKTLVAQAEVAPDLDEDSDVPVPEAPKKPTEDTLLKKAVEMIATK